MQDILIHYGIQGQKWGVRRYQTKDGKRTAEGKKRYAKKKNGKIITDAVLDNVGEEVLKVTSKTAISAGLATLTAVNPLLGIGATIIGNAAVNIAAPKVINQINKEKK